MKRRPLRDPKRDRRRAGRVALRVGLLGGSFNPAHPGHRHISLLALELLALDQVWWLISPHNPLKPEAGMAPYAERVAGARRLARHPRIRLNEIEQRWGTRFTDETLRGLVRRHPRTRFVWIMGADNLDQIPRWRHWPRIFATVPIAVFDRPTYSLRALAGKAARRFRRARIAPRRASLLSRMAPPAWVFLSVAHDPESASALRRMGRAAQDESKARRPAP